MKIHNFYLPLPVAIDNPNLENYNDQAYSTTPEKLESLIIIGDP